MDETPWYVTFFGEDYLRIYAPFLPQEKTEQEVEDILHLLNMSPGTSILDLCCGYGRHTIPLARRGYQMTGQDLSAPFLQRARKDAEAQDVEINWLQGDMRTIPFENTFDAIINIFTSFGYFKNTDGDQGDQRVLQQVQKALKPGGFFLLETVYQPRVVRAFTPHGFTRYNDGMLVLEERRIDLLASSNEIQITILTPDGQRSEYNQSIRIYTLTELVGMLERAGLHVLASYGGLDGSVLTLDSRMVILAQKPRI